MASSPGILRRGRGRCHSKCPDRHDAFSGDAVILEENVMKREFYYRVQVVAFSVMGLLAAAEAWISLNTPEGTFVFTTWGLLWLVLSPILVVSAIRRKELTFGFPSRPETLRTRSSNSRGEESCAMIPSFTRATCAPMPATGRRRATATPSPPGVGEVRLLGGLQADPRHGFESGNVSAWSHSVSYSRGSPFSPTRPGRFCLGTSTQSEGEAHKHVEI